MFGKVGLHLGNGAADTFLEHLRNLAHGRHRTVSAKGLGKLSQRLDHAIGRFVEYHRARLRGQLRQTRGAPFLLRQEALEGEPLAGQGRRYEGGHEGGRSWQTLHAHTARRTGPYEHESGVGDGGCASIGNQGHVFARSNASRKGFGRLVLVELMVRTQSVLDVEMFEEHPRCPRVFRQNQVHLFENPQGAKRDVFEVAHGCRYEIECSHAANLWISARVANKVRFKIALL